MIDALHPQNLKVSVLEMLSELVSALTDDSLTSILKSTVASSMVKAGMGTRAIIGTLRAMALTDSSPVT